MQPSFLGTRLGSTRSEEMAARACPIRCHTMLKVPAVSAKYGIPEVGQNTCAGLLFGRAFFKTFPDGPKGQTAIEACMVGMHLADDLGIWENYGQLQRDFQKLYYEGILSRQGGPRRNSKAIHGTNMKKAIHHSSSSFCQR